MYSTILLLIIGIAALGYCLRHSQANTAYLKNYAKRVDDQLDELEENRRKDAELIKQLTWERDAAHFMLETVIDDLPSDHQVTMVRRPWAKKQTKNNLHFSTSVSEVPGQRNSDEALRKAYFKDHSI